MADPSRTAEREKVFYDRKWAAWTPRVITRPLDAEGAIDLRGKRILICGCGTGTEAVRAARAGAEVHAFDISPVAVEQTRRLATFNGVSVDARVMDFHHLQYPDDFFDAAYGQWILHHVDCALAGRELYRVLRPGGVAWFKENSDANPLIMWFRRLVFGRPGTPHRSTVAFIRRIGSADEDPLSSVEVATLREIFDGNLVVRRSRFVFFSLIAKHMWRHPRVARVTVWLDQWLTRAAPFLLRYSFTQTIWLRKPDSPARSGPQSAATPPAVTP